MLGARTAHEWAHLAVDAGWVPQTASAERFAELTTALSAPIEAVIAAAPASVREQTGADLAELASETSPGTALSRLLLLRMPDYQANILARHFMDETERETYVRHNIRTLRAEYSPDRLWRMLVRYLHEFQYLRLSAVEDPLTYFVRSTWFDLDFFATGVLDEKRFEHLAGAVAALCGCYGVDESKLRLPPGHDETEESAS